MVNNSSITASFALWTSKTVDTVAYSTYYASNVYNNDIASGISAHSSIDYSGSNVSTDQMSLIIRNIPQTVIDDIQAIILYNRDDTTWSNRTVGDGI